jgi:hypothetical protein
VGGALRFSTEKQIKRIEGYAQLLTDLKASIQAARTRVALAANQEVIALLGHRQDGCRAPAEAQVGRYRHRSSQPGFAAGVPQRGQAASKQGKSARDLKIFFARSWWQDDFKALNHLATMILPTPIIFFP